MRNIQVAVLASLLVLPAVGSAQVPGQVVPVAVYTDVPSAFGLAYDSANDLIWYTTSATCLIPSLAPYKNFSAAQLATFVLLPNGIPEVPAALAQNGAFTTDPLAGGGSCPPQGALAYDESIGQLTAQSTTAFQLQSFDPFTGLNHNPNYRPGSDPIANPLGGYDVDGDLWLAYNRASIYKNGVLFADWTNPAQTTLPFWFGAGTATGWGWQGVERVCDSLYAVAVHGDGFTPGPTSATLVRLDPSNASLIGYDPDGFGFGLGPVDLAYDGRYLYVADVYGDANGTGVAGDVYVFEVTGGLKDPGCADDHLKCYKVKDPLKLSGFVDLDSPQFGLEKGCKISRAKYFCAPVTKTVIEVHDPDGPIDPLPYGDHGPLTNADRICYKIKCPLSTIPDTPVGDQFANRTISKFSAKLVCTPARKMCRFTGIHMCGGDCPDPADMCIVAPDDSECICVPRPTPTPGTTSTPTAPFLTPTPTVTLTPTPAPTTTPVCPTQCIGGPNNGQPCSTASHCPAGACATPPCCCDPTGYPACTVNADCVSSNLCVCP